MNTNPDFQIVEGNGSGRIAILRVVGRLDASTAPALLERCAPVQARGQNLVLNLSGVTFLGSSGVGALLVLVEQFQEQSGAVHLVDLSQPAKTVVELLDLARYLPIHRSEAEAVAKLAA